MPYRRFGWLPETNAYRAGFLVVVPLQSAQNVIQSICVDPRSDETWLHPPLVPSHTGRPSKNRPHVHAEAFLLPPTHRIETNLADDPDLYLEFQIQVLGLTKGLHLIPEDWSHFYRVALRIGAFSDLSCSSRDVEAVLGQAEAFWLANSSRELRRLIFGAVHWHLFAESYVHEYERFNAQYMVLDTCFRIHCILTGAAPPSVSHGKRPSYLCGQYGMSVPLWAQPDPIGQCALSRFRNELVHEARYAGEPVGFAHPPDPYPLDIQLRSFNARLILALLGVRASYINSQVDTRNCHGLGLP